MVIPCRAWGKPSVFDVLDKKEEPPRPSPPCGFADAGDGGHQASLLRKSLNCSDLANKRAVGANGRLPRSKPLALLGCRSRRKGTFANGSAGCRLKAAASPADGAQSIGWCEEIPPKTSHPNRGLLGVPINRLVQLSLSCGHEPKAHAFLTWYLAITSFNGMD